MQRSKSFFGGIYPPEAKKRTAAQPFEILPAPDTLVVPLWQYGDLEAVPLVAKGEQVLKGQLLAEASSEFGAAVHSPVSGKVAAVEPRPHPCGQSVLAVVIENDELESWVEKETHPDPLRLEAAVISEKIKAAGVVGMGGGGFPTALKLNPPQDTVLDYLIINGCECEPYLTADERIMVEYPAEVVLGAKLMAKVCGAGRIIIALEDNKPAAWESLQKEAGTLEVVALPTKYPQGGEKQLIQALTGREVPRGGFPYQAGVLVQNVSTAWAVAKAVRDGEPLISRPLTVTGKPLAQPKNFLVPLGTPFEYLCDAAGGFQEPIGKVVVGGPLMGVAQFNLDASVCKAVTGLLILGREESKAPPVLPCIKCGRCVQVCPARLMPLRLEAFGLNEMWDEAWQYGVFDCIECGACNYICPSKRPLLQYIRLAKREILAIEKKSS